MELLENPVRPYAWGSRTVIADLLGEPVPSPHPQAELWLGAHPGDPSRLAGKGRSLLEVLNADPETLLGAERSARWSGTLPFLLKVLAADEPLSLQAHPSLAQAQEGFARENAQGIPLDASHRNYKDANHKPELICALTEFHALVGFRDPMDTLALLRALNVAELAAHVDLLAAQPDPDGLRALFTTWITLPQGMLDELVPAVQKAAVALAGADDEWAREARTALELSERYPGDAGVLAALLLNRVVLQPGEASYLPAGNLHAYLQGAGIELMANSDNVLRGGLTSKHVDVPELLRVLDFTAGPPPVHHGSPEGEWTRYDTPAEEFLLRTWHGPEGLTTRLPVPEGGARILLCTAGKTCVRAGDDLVELEKGAALFLGAHESGVEIESASPGTHLHLAGDAL
ncbi:mannose-6-phosphate isomerase, class I [Pseudonocardia xishanensis]|uniref:mannose-6-phosphate isomerase n=1 Tax=Pseudonocardia xishanensis TaxID=630995 RepID=A0ABP8RJX9_9PSEU